MKIRLVGCLLILLASCISAVVDIPDVCKDSHLTFKNSSFPSLTTTVEIDSVVDLSHQISDLASAGTVSISNLSDTLTSKVGDFYWVDRIEIEASPSQQNNFITIVNQQLTPDQQGGQELILELLTDNETMLKLLAAGPVDLKFKITGRVPAEIDMNSRLCADINVDIKKNIK